MSTLEMLRGLLANKTIDDNTKMIIGNALWILETIHIKDNLSKPEINRLIEEN